MLTVPAGWEHPMGRVVRPIAVGEAFEVLSARRQRGGDGHLWNYLVLRILSGVEAGTVAEYLVGLADRESVFPFMIVSGDSAVP